MATLREVKKWIRNIALAVVVASGILFVGHGTANAELKLSLGPKGGLALAKFSGDDVTDAKRRSGFSGGGFILFELSRSFGIQTEVLYVTKGNKFDGGLTSKHDYIAFPLMIKYMLPLTGSVRPGVFLGGEASFNHSAKLTNGGEIDIDSEIADFDFGIIFGGECSFKTSTGAAIIDVRYTRGLRGLDEAGAGLDFKQDVVSIMAGYAFSIGK